MQFDPRSNREMFDIVAAPVPALGRARRSRGNWARAIEALLALGGEHAELLRHAERPWASATFSGSRHTAALSFSGAEAMAAGERFVAELPDHEFTIPGQLVADAAITEVSMAMLPEPVLMVEVELLLLDDA
ncbi:MAG: hypothetical protein ABI673_05285 [Novosphingobium sp.]